MRNIIHCSRSTKCIEESRTREFNCRSSNKGLLRKSSLKWNKKIIIRLNQAFYDERSSWKDLNLSTVKESKKGSYFACEHRTRWIISEGKKNEQKGIQCNNRSTFTSLNSATRWLQGTDVITAGSSSVISAESACQAIRRWQGGTVRDRTEDTSGIVRNGMDSNYYVQNLKK
ncbi:hypothetical protein TNCT_450361 [Trichonephila clavata]|uniref:Uncharacterized protein n=1 Tax=Trichonephila clavata TaxID=2740835 RepID=A0A8X6K9C4_TRICU|nr:hypothetical protein TNCT_450361 [Trichonephila clavata]